MALVRTIVTDALMEIGVLAAGESLDANLGALGLLRFQNQLDSWQADRLSLSLQLRTPFTLPSGTSTVTVGTGGTVNITRPMFVNSVAYVIPGSSPAVEVPIGLMDDDTYAGLSIKALQSTLPTQAFYSTNLTDAFGSLFVWPQVTQNVTLVLYTPQAVDVPATLDTNVIGPAGYAEAFVYSLALRLCAPTGTAAPEGLPILAANAMQTMRRPNVQPGILNVDPAITLGTDAGYNVYSDTTRTSR